MLIKNATCLIFYIIYAVYSLFKQLTKNSTCSLYCYICCLCYISNALIFSDEPPGKRKKKSEDASETASYERQPRKLGKSYGEDDIDTANRIHLLPLKGKDGLIKRSIMKDDNTAGNYNHAEIFSLA